LAAGLKGSRLNTSNIKQVPDALGFDLAIRHFAEKFADL